MAKILIVYFSHSGMNYVGGEIVCLNQGNTEVLARKIFEHTGGDIVELETFKKYPHEYRDCTEVAKAEQRENARPALLESIDISGYDTVILGYPNWWGTMPMAVWTFLESGDFSGKTIMPFCTHEGSGMGRSIGDIAKLCPDAVIAQGLSVVGSRVSEADGEIERWLRQNILQ